MLPLLRVYLSYFIIFPFLLVLRVDSYFLPLFFVTLISPMFMAWFHKHVASPISFMWLLYVFADVVVVVVLHVVVAHSGWLYPLMKTVNALLLFLYSEPYYVHLHHYLGC